MLVLGHVGVSLGAVWAFSSAARLIAPDPKEGDTDASSRGHPLRSPDFRMVVVGSMLPDIIDKPVWLLWALGDGRFPFHTLAFQALLIAVGLVLWWRYRWIAIWGLGMGSLLHTLEDEMWGNPDSYLWPVYGWAFPEESTTGFVPLLVRGLLHAPRVYVPEVAGAIIIIVFAAIVVRRRRVGSFIRYGTMW